MHCAGQPREGVSGITAGRFAGGASRGVEDRRQAPPGGRRGTLQILWTGLRVQPRNACQNCQWVCRSGAWVPCGWRLLGRRPPLPTCTWQARRGGSPQRRGNSNFLAKQGYLTTLNPNGANSAELPKIPVSVTKLLRGTEKVYALPTNTTSAPCARLLTASVL